MDISRVQQSIITRDFEVKDERGEVIDRLSVTWDRNLFTGELDRRQGRVYAEMVKEVDARIRQLYPDLVPEAPATNGNRHQRRANAKITKASPLTSVATTEVATAAVEEQKPDEPENRLLQMAEQFVLQKDTDAMLADIGRDTLADTMAVDRYGLIKEWGMTDNGTPVPPNFDVLKRQSVTFLRDLLEWMREESNPKKALTPRATTTADSTSAT